MPSNKVGKEFERQVANDIKKAFSVGNTECFRTPMSGGHHALPGTDIQMGPELFKRFPYAIECKNDKRFRFGQWMNPTGNLLGWLKQVRTAASDIPGAVPLLITNEKHIGVFCAVPSAQAPSHYVDRTSAHLKVTIRGREWLITHWREFLEYSVEHAANIAAAEKRRNKRK